MPLLEREEYIEQSYLFRMLGQRLQGQEAAQDLLAAIREEILATTKLPMAIDFMLSELKHQGAFAPAMRRLDHYFTPFQTYVIEEAENELGRFDLRVALQILERQADYLAAEAPPQGMFLYALEAICRNRLRYDRGLQALALDPLFDEPWQSWIRVVRRQVGMVELADLIYLRSEYGLQQQGRRAADKPREPPLFGIREGRIAAANRHKDPLLLFSALHRQLGYPAVPAPKPVAEDQLQLPQLARRLEQMERRLKLLEEEEQGGIDLQPFYRPPDQGDER